VSGPYPAIDRWIVPESAITATLLGVRPAGRRGRESGAFWLGTRTATSVVTDVVLPRGEGVIEHPGYWQVSPEVFGAISGWAKPRRLTLLSIAHIHLPGVPARLSWSDRHLSVRVPGVLAVVIGNGGDAADYRDWGWYVHEAGDFRLITEGDLARRIAVPVDGDVEVWTASMEGVCQVTRGQTG
jgi:hypothetical protein